MQFTFHFDVQLSIKPISYKININASNIAIKIFFSFVLSHPTTVMAQIARRLRSK